MPRSFFFIILLLSCMQAWAQVAELTVKNQAINGNDYTFDIYIRREFGSEDIYLGISDFNLTFNEQSFANPTISKVPGASPGSCTFVSSIADPTLVRANYFDNTAPSINGADIFINLNIPGPNSQSAFDERLAKIDGATSHCLGRFKMTGMIGGSVGLQWRTTANPKTVVGIYENDAPEFDAATISYNALDPPEMILPIELISFDGTLTERNDVLLEWRTQTEIENQGFNVERLSSDQASWQFLDHVLGRGNTWEVSEYRYVDQFPSPGSNHYRLKQIDFDGSWSYSPIINIDYHQVDVGIFPNPVNDILIIKSGSGHEFIISDVLGKNKSKGIIQNGQVEVSNLANGTYFLLVAGRQFKFVKH